MDIDWKSFFLIDCSIPEEYADTCSMEDVLKKIGKYCF